MGPFKKQRLLKVRDNISTASTREQRKLCVPSQSSIALITPPIMKDNLLMSMQDFIAVQVVLGKLSAGSVQLSN